MSIEFQKTQQQIAEAIANRTISCSPKKARRYEDGDYRPFFSLADREGKLICIWCSNLKKPNPKGKGGDAEIVRLSHADVTVGLGTKNDSAIKDWDIVTKLVMKHFGTWPKVTQKTFAEAGATDKDAKV